MIYMLWSDTNKAGAVEELSRRGISCTEIGYYLLEVPGEGASIMEEWGATPQENDDDQK